MNVNRNIKLTSVFASLSLTVVLTLMFIEIQRLNFFVIFSFILIIFFSLNRLVFSEYKFSIEKCVWGFVAFFLGIAPLYQFINNIVPWGGRFPDSDYVIANVVILIFILIFSLASRLSQAKKVQLNIIKPTSVDYEISKLACFISVLLSLFALYIVFQEKGIVGLLFRNPLEDVVDSAKSSRLLIDQVVRPVSAVFLFVFILKLRTGIYNRTQQITACCLFVLTLITLFPTSIARYYLASIYLPLMLIAFEKRIDRTFFPIFIFFALFILFPILSALRNISDESIMSKITNQIVNGSSFYGGDFDSYSMLIRSINFYEEASIPFFKQLLGPLFFYVPRSVWPDKPVGTGMYVAENSGMIFTNVSSPLIAEGYINGGMFGVVLFAFVLGAAVTRYDRYFWRSNNVSLGRAFYLSAFPLFFFMMRGDLLSSFTFITARFFVFCLCIATIMSFRFKSNK